MKPLRLNIAVSLFLIFAVFVSYWQVFDHGFVNFDDDVYVTENKRVQAGITSENIIWAIKTTDAGFWHPLTWMSHMLDCELYGLNPVGHHFTSLLLHIANTLLLFFVLKRMTRERWSSAFVAALFALHPLHVESVAWVAERKDVLSTLFWMLTMWAYTYYTERPAFSRYIPLLLLFVLGLMAKSMLVTLPFLLLVLDYWPLGRFRVEQRESMFRLFLEKIPLLAFTVLFCILSFLAQQKTGIVAPLDAVPVNMRLANALVSYIVYIWKMVWPEHLAMFYPFPEIISTWKVAGSVFLLACLTAVFYWKRRQFPYLMVGWLWYLGTLVPVIGVVHFGGHAMADRYTYVPIIGLFIIVVWGTQDLLTKFNYCQHVILTLAGGAMIILIMCTWSQVGYWKNDVSLEGRAADVTDSFKAHYNLGLALMMEKDLENAGIHFTKAIEIKPDYAIGFNNLGLTLMWQNKLDEAVEKFSEALKIDSRFYEAHYNMGLALMKQGKRNEAIRQYRKALQIRPSYPRARKALARALH